MTLEKETAMLNNSNEIKCIEDAISLVRWKTGLLSDLNDGILNYEDQFPKGTWFRGQENSEWELSPSAFRRINGELVYGESEPIIVSDFKLRYAKDQKDMSDSFDWLCLMQHHGCPTRILDFSENILIALYFAVRDNPMENGNPGSLFVLNSIKLNYHTAGGLTHLRAGDFPCWLRSQQAEDTTLEAISFEIATSRPSYLSQFKRKIANDKEKWAEYMAKPIAALPRVIHERMIRQQSVFTVFGGTYAKKNGDIPAPVFLDDLNNKLEPELKFLRRFEIPASCKEAIRRDLQAVGIHVASLFPEMQYQAAFIRDAHKVQISKKVDKKSRNTGRTMRS